MPKTPVEFVIGSPQTEWDEIQVRISRGEHPLRAEIARVLRRNEYVPSEVRNYVADILEGKVRRPRGHHHGSEFRRKYQCKVVKLVCARLDKFAKRGERRNLARAVREIAHELVTKTPTRAPAESTIREWVKKHTPIPN